MLNFIVENGKVQTDRDAMTASIVLDAQKLSAYCEKIIQKGGEWKSLFAGLFDHSRGMIEGCYDLNETSK